MKKELSERGQARLRLKASRMLRQGDRKLVDSYVQNRLLETRLDNLTSQYQRVLLENAVLKQRAA